jgi:hypothetical protein
VTTFGIPP